MTSSSTAPPWSPAPTDVGLYRPDAPFSNRRIYRGAADLCPVGLSVCGLGAMGFKLSRHAGESLNYIREFTDEREALIQGINHRLEGRVSLSAVEGGGLLKLAFSYPVLDISQELRQESAERIGQNLQDQLAACKAALEEAAA